MARPFSIIDPLWQCLCPSWRAATVPRVVRHLQLSNRARCIARTRRTIHKDTRPAKVDISEVSDESMSVDSLHARLDVYSQQGNVNGCQRVVKHLLEKRGARLSTSFYNALILANVDSSLGGAWRVRELLEEMGRERYAPDSITCHNILKVLAVHPDHLLRTDTLVKMSQNWFTISKDGYHDIAAGWLREGCIELAMDVLDTLQQKAIPVEPWLLDMFVYSLCDAGQIEPAYEILQIRLETGEMNMSRPLWHYFLDAAANARYLAGTELAWSEKVGLDQLQASTGIVENALTTAALHGAPALATKVIAHLARRGDIATHFHYQQLIDSYMNHRVPDISKAISVLSVMTAEKVQPTKWQTRSLYNHIRSSASLTDKAVRAINQLHDKGRLVPLAAINLVLESYASQGRLAAAINLYKQIGGYVASTGPAPRMLPDSETYHILLDACQMTDIEQVDTLYSEMLAAQISPDVRTYDRVISLNAQAALQLALQARARGDDVREACAPRANAALAYYDNMSSLSFTPTPSTLESLAVAMAATGDTQSYEIVESAPIVSADMSRIVFDKIREWLPRPSHLITNQDTECRALKAHG